MSQPGELAVLSIGTAANSLAEVADIQTMSLGAVTQDPVDDYSLGSTSKATRPSRLPDFGSLTVSFWYSAADATHKLLRDSSKNAATLYGEIETEDGQIAVISGYITSFEFGGMEVDENVTVDFEFKINTLTFTDPAPFAADITLPEGDE